MSLEKAIAIAFYLILENDFRALLNQLGLDISKERVAKPWRQAYRLGSYFVGLEIRTAEDDSLVNYWRGCKPPSRLGDS